MNLGVALLGVLSPGSQRLQMEALVAQAEPSGHHLYFCIWHLGWEDSNSGHALGITLHLYGILRRERLLTLQFMAGCPEHVPGESQVLPLLMTKPQNHAVLLPLYLLDEASTKAYPGSRGGDSYPVPQQVRGPGTFHLSTLCSANTPLVTKWLLQRLHFRQTQQVQQRKRKLS